MKVLAIASPEHYEMFQPDTVFCHSTELHFLPRDSADQDIVHAIRDADALFVDPVTAVSAAVMDAAPHLRLIHSEGVGYDRIDLAAARNRNIAVCNNAGCNAPAVAELSIMLMTMLLHRMHWGERMVRTGRQGEAVNRLVVDVPKDLADCTVGLVGCGAIGSATARLLQVYGATIVYTARHRKSPEEEAYYQMTYLSPEELAAQSDIVSLHLPATAETHHMVDAAYLARMKPTAFLINTARGAIVDDNALCHALRSGGIAGAALDAYSPEPLPVESPLLQLAMEEPDKLVLSPHQGGISRSCFLRAQSMMWDNLERLSLKKPLLRVVNGSSPL